MRVRTRLRSTGNRQLDEVIILLFQNQLAFQAQQARSDQRFVEQQKEILQIRLELEQLKTIVLRHEQMLTKCCRNWQKYAA
ncbi:MAG: hypothetical protein DMG13_23355 [Acidobacteria bacterium]|nr:MAG: hypothetical protein DMG13_23355 [Acidobacteriota bacterium]